MAINTQTRIPNFLNLLFFRCPCEETFVPSRMLNLSHFNGFQQNRSVQSIKISPMNGNLNWTTETPANQGVSPEETAYEWLIFISAPLIFTLGVIGNILTVVVMATAPSFRKLNTTVYFTGLAVADTVCLCVQRLTRTWLEMVFGVMLDVYSSAGCKILMYVHYSSSISGSWIIVAVTVERLVVVCFPLKARAICTRRVSTVTLGLILLVVCGLNIYTLFLFDIEYDTTNGFYYCLQLKKEHVLISSLVDYTLYSLLPSLCLWTANSILIYKLKASRDFQRSASVYGSGTDSQKTPKISLTLLAISFTFLILTTPLSLFYIIQAFHEIPQTDGVILGRQVLEVLSSLNPAINFFLYCMSGPLFRYELISLCKCKIRHACCKGQTHHSQDSSGDVIITRF